MKFAVVEYNSKSGDIWRHRDDQPNYLADPQTEIDPTSFGCYVSALKGEHIPLSGLIAGKAGNDAAWIKKIRKIYKRLTGSFPSYSLDYLHSFDALMMVHQLSDAHEMVKAVERMRTSASRPVLIGVPTQPYGILRPAVESDAKAMGTLKRHMDACDVFICVVESTKHWYQQHTKTPVEYVPQPYPVRYATKRRKDVYDKHKRILVAGVTQRDAIKQGQNIAVRLQKQFPEHKILIPKVHDLDYDFSNLQGSNYEVLPFEKWHKHLDTLANTRLVINTDYTHTRGRVQTDCAAVGTPSLGGNSDGQVDLFPELASQPTTDTDDLVELGGRLLDDDEYYANVVAHASRELDKYNYEQSAKRMQDLVERYGGPRP